MKLRGGKFPKELLLYKAYNSVVEILVLDAKDIHGFKSNWMNKHLHLAGVADKTLGLSTPVA